MVLRLSDVEKRVVKLEQRLASQVEANKQSVTITDNQIILHSLTGRQDKIYVPSKTAIKFHSSNSLVRLIIGPYGSGKSTMCCVEIVKRACEMPKCLDGVRRCRVICVRNTYSDLKLTTLDVWNEWTRDCLPCFMSHDKPLERLYKFNDGHGPVELHLIFLPLDKVDDISHLKSMPATFIYANELSELVKFVFDNFTGRSGRYPSQNDCPHEYWNGIIADTNPPDTDHWIHDSFELNRPEGYEIYHQPPAMLKAENGEWIMNPEAENIEHLSSGYYQKLVLGKADEFTRVFACGEYGSATDGKLVFSNYNDDIHGIDNISPIIDAETPGGLDYGVQASAFLVGQVQGQQLCIIKEFICEEEGIASFAERVVIPWLQHNMDMTKVIFQGDPAGRARQITDLNNPQHVLNTMGLRVEPASTNDIESRIEAVNYFFDRLPGGKPAIRISKSGCPTLRTALLKKYIKKRKKDLNRNEYDELPYKSHPFSDIVDALQYLCLKYAIIKRKNSGAKDNKATHSLNPSL